MKETIFRKIKRVISQFIETEYFYRFRKRKDYYYNNSFIMADTWNGSSTLIEWQLMKVEHMYVNLRKYGNEAKCYIDSSDFLKYANSSDKALAISKLIDEMKKEDNQKLYIGNDYFLGYDKSVNSYIIYKRSVDKVIPASELKHPNSRLEYIDGKFNFIPCDETVYKFENIRNCPFYSDAINGLLMLDDHPFKDKDEVENNIINYSQAIHFEVTDLASISKDVKMHLRGQRQKLHNIWRYRFLLKKLLNLDFSDGVWFAKTDEIHQMYEYGTITEKEKFILYQKCWDEFLEYRKSILDEITKLWNETSDLWWD